MKTSKALLVMIGSVLFVLGCGKHKKIESSTKTTSKKHEKAPEKKAGKTTGNKKIAVNNGAKKTNAPGKAANAPAASSDVASKANIEKCYLEVYCAQKHGDMAGLLKIYKKYGFETPKQWTRAYIAAAKDTDWVSALARKASKACKKTKKK